MDQAAENCFITDTGNGVNARVALALYAITGFTGILAEQGFEKYMSLLVGATAAASTVVICAYFLGFAGGSWVTAALMRKGKICRPLRAYGLLEFSVGASCVIFAAIFHPLTAILAPLQVLAPGPILQFAARFFFGAVLVLPAAALMGASFPLIAQVVDARNESLGQAWLQAYALNLTGAIAAALLAPYILMPAIGVRGCFFLCLGLCTLVMAVCLLLDQKRTAMTRQSLAAGSQADDDHPAPKRMDRDEWILVVGAFASGFMFFALEVLWTHLIGTTLGCSVYAFSSMLAAVLAGLLLGAFRVNTILSKKREISYSRLFQFSALLLVIQFRLWDWIQAAFLVPLPAWLRNFYGVEGFKLLLAAIMIVPSAAILGAIFPSLLRSPVLTRPGRTWLVGYLNTGNSAGCIAGALLGIFVLIPVAGSQLSIRLMILTCLAFGLLFLWREHTSRKALIRGVLGIALVSGYALWWKWDTRLMTSGLNVYFGRPPEANVVPDPNEHSTTDWIFFDEHSQGGLTTVLETTTVRTGAEPRRIRTLYTNGKYEGSDDMRDQGMAQIGVAAVPSLYVPRMKSALLIGLGTGHSALALARVGYEHVTVAEFAPGIISAAKQTFAAFNENVLSFPNVRVRVEDGRNVLLTDPAQKYSLITTEIASVWFAGATNVYSQEFYRLVKSRLEPGGVMQQWVQVHHIGSPELGSAIATARSVFPYVSFWYAGGQGMIVATSEPQFVTDGREDQITSRIRPLIGGVGGPEADKLAHDLLHSRVMAPEAVDAMIHQLNPVINTDQNRWLEYATPKYNWSGEDWVTRNLQTMRTYESEVEPHQASR